MQCLEYAKIKYMEITGKSNPSSGGYPGDYWDNASQTTSTIREYCIAIWINNDQTNQGHALCVGQLVPGLNKYECFEANWDYNGNTKTRYWTSAEIKQLYRSKVFKGYVYN